MNKYKKILVTVLGVLGAVGASYWYLDINSVNSDLSTLQGNDNAANIVTSTGLNSSVIGNNSLEYNTVTNNGNNSGVMVGKLEVSSRKEGLNANDKAGILKWITQNKSEEIHITYSPSPLEARKLALSIRDFLASEHYNVLYPEQVQLGGGMCESEICFANEGKSIHVN